MNESNALLRGDVEQVARVNNQLSAGLYSCGHLFTKLAHCGWCGKSTFVSSICIGSMDRVCSREPHGLPLGHPPVAAGDVRVAEMNHAQCATQTVSHWHGTTKITLLKFVVFGHPFAYVRSAPLKFRCSLLLRGGRRGRLRG